MEESLLQDAAAAVQLLQQQEQQQQQQQHQVKSPPEPLPIHWVIRESRSQPGYYYYFNYETGVCSWQPPYNAKPLITTPSSSSSSQQQNQQQQYSLEELSNLSAAAMAATALNNNSNSSATSTAPTLLSTDTGNSNKRPLSSSSSSADVSNKRSHHSTTSENSSNREKLPSQVRVIHILRKHKDSRKPTSWRVPGTITTSKEEARQEIQNLLDVLREVQNDPAELRATIEELARTESDCSSYKRNGDLGYFGRKKMQPTFEDAAFHLSVNELSDIVETSSGLHILLRIG